MATEPLSEVVAAIAAQERTNGQLQFKIAVLRALEAAGMHTAARLVYRLPTDDGPEAEAPRTPTDARGL